MYDMPPATRVGRAVEQAAQRRGLDSLRDIERHTGVGRETIRKLYAGIGMPAETTLKKLSESLGLSLTVLRELAGRPVGESTPFVVPPEADQLTDRQRRVVLDMIAALLEAGRGVTQR